MLLQDIFINRKKELDEISSGIALGQSFIIIAPRRYGKTTLIKKIAKNKRTPVGHKRDFFEISDTEIFQFLCPKRFSEGLFLGLEMSSKRGSQIIGHQKNRTPEKAR